MAPEELVERARALVVDVPDYPQPGVVFKDITPLLGDGATFGAVVRHMGRSAGDVDLVVGMEARGFIFGAAVAAAVGAGFVPVRKPGKLPRSTVSAAYDLEYGSAVLELHADAVPRGSRVLVVDDVLATGGTAVATLDLIEQAGGEVAGLAFLMELGFLEGRSRLEGRRLEVLLTY